MTAHDNISAEWRGKLDRWQNRADEALAGFKADCEAICWLTGIESEIWLINARTHLGLAVLLAGESEGVLQPGTAEHFRRSMRRIIRPFLRATFQHAPLPAVSERAIVVREAYRRALRPANAGARDSRMQAAMLFAANFEGTDSRDPVGTVSKSLDRLRKHLRGKFFLTFDPVTLRIELADAEAKLLVGLPNKRGRPRV